MAEGTPRKKKLVRSTIPAESAAGEAGATWTPTPEAKKQATKLRIFAFAAWLVAIGIQVFAIFWLLKQVPFTNGDLILLISLIVVVGALAILGSWLWKKSNRLDPASEENAFKFWVQNQLGVIMTLLACLPLIAVVLLNKNMDGKQKAIAGVVAVAVAGLAVFMGIDFDPVSTEDLSSQSNEVVKITGKDEVFWTKSGKVYHLCEGASAVNQESKDNTIYSGTVSQAIAAGKERLTKQVDLEIEQCGLTPVASTPTATATP